ncbi:MAG: hypothetical protein E7384_07340 [Ruminococcaceae bacterium]|nr:hypothetical protein [Oscillospiraceae bacterium]
MNRDEILEKSRKENKDEDEREKNLRSKAAIPFIAAFGIAFFFFVIFERLVLNTSIIHHVLGTTLFFSISAEFWFIAIAIKRSKTNYFSAICFTICFISEVAMLIMYLKEIL